jgi:hypothetical protein
LLGGAFFQILQRGERSRIDGLHKLQITEALTLLNRLLKFAAVLPSGFQADYPSHAQAGRFRLFHASP